MRGALPLLLLLSACGQSSDGYRFETAEFERESPGVRVVVHASLAELRKAAPANAQVKGRDLYAWSYITRDACEMHIVDPRISYQPEWIGHETAHCIYGRWHP